MNTPDDKAGITLLPCPFCGNSERPRLIDDHELDGKPMGGCYVVCCARAGAPGCGASSGWHQTREESITEWNRREMASAELHRLDPRLERLADRAARGSLNPNEVVDAAARLGAALLKATSARSAIPTSAKRVCCQASPLAPLVAMCSDCPFNTTTRRAKDG